MNFPILVTYLMMMNKVYDNIELIAPNGQLLSFISKRRANWYIKKGLTSYYDNNKVVLNFEPNGYGDSEPEKNRRDNRCVVCGTHEHLTRHHAVPYAFRKHFPNIYKNNNSADVIPVCREHHNEYEVFADDEKRKLFNRLAKKEIQFNKDLTIARKSLADLDFFEIMDPIKAFERNEKVKEFILKYNIDRSEIRKSKLHQIETVVIDKIGIDNVVRLFKNHFEKTMDCNFLPNNWDANEVKVTDKR